MWVPGTSVTGSYTFDKNGQGQIQFLSADFSDSVRTAHTAAMEVRVDDGQDTETEIGGKSFIPDPSTSPADSNK
jgi:hypothetical protein